MELPQGPRQGREAASSPTLAARATLVTGPTPSIYPANCLPAAVRQEPGQLGAAGPGAADRVGQELNKQEHEPVQARILSTVLMPSALGIVMRTDYAVYLPVQLAQVQKIVSITANREILIFSTLKMA